MAREDVKIKESPYITTPTQEWETAAGASLVKGDIAVASAGSENASRVTNGGGTTSQIVLGLVAEDSSDTASVAGKVKIYKPLPGIVYRCKATTAGNADTQAKLDALKGNKVAFDLTGTTITVDEDQASAATNGVAIVGGDPSLNEIWFELADQVTWRGNNTT